MLLNFKMNDQQDGVNTQREGSFGSPARPNPKISVRVQINPTEDVHVFEKERSYIRQRTTSETKSFSSESQKSTNIFQEPQSMFEIVHSFLTNSYVEITATTMGILAIVLPNYISLILTILIQITLIGIPSYLFREASSKRLGYYNLVAKALIGLTTLVLGLKIYLVNAFDDLSQLRSWGVFNYDKKVTELNIFFTFSYEILVIGLLLVILAITQSIQAEFERSKKLKVMTRTFLGCQDFSHHRKIYKYVFITFTFMELLLVPDLLALPILMFFLILMIAAFIHKTTERNRQTTVRPRQDTDFYSASALQRVGLVQWAMKDERLFTITMECQKVLMMIQLFEFLLMNIDSVRKEFLRNLKGESDFILHFQILRYIGHAEYQVEVIQDQILHYQVMFITVMIIFFSQISTKAYAQHKRLVSQIDNFEEIQSRGNSVSGLIEDESPKKIGFGIKQVLQTDDDDLMSMDDIRKTIYGFLPVILCWLLRITIVFFVYMYNCYVSFYHLFWILTSFFIPTALFYHISVLVLLPISCLEFSLVYVSNIQGYQSSDIFKLPYFKEYNFTAVSPFWELSLMFSVLVMLGLMVPARLRYMAYDRHHKGSDMIKDLIVDKIKSKSSNVLWKFGFITVISMHNLIIFCMLFAGNQSFNMFQLGFMFFFVAYSASDYLYQKTSILLPIFISFFILAQYYWSVRYKDHYETYEHQRDFFNMIDGWQPDENKSFYWARLPNIKLWALLILMNVLHSVAKMFPDYEQNQKYIEECDRQIAAQYPRLTKWAKRTRNIVFMIVLVVLFFMMARDLIKQKPNLFNLIYLILFMVTFGKMCITSIDGNSTKDCLKLAKYIKRYSAIVLSLIVIYHMMRFEFFDLDAWFRQKKEEKNFFVLYLQLIGFGEDEVATTGSVQLYTAYMIVGQILHKYFHDSVQSQEGRDLFNWSEALKTNQGVLKANEYFRFDHAYLIYQLFDLWPVIDAICTYFHLFTNGVIVYFSITVSISLFYAMHLSLIVFFYCYSSFKLIEASKANIGEVGSSVTLDLQSASDLCRLYKKASHDIFLNIRKRLWMTQYSITLIFVFAGYLDPMISQMIQQADGMRLQRLQTLQFYMYWSGVSYPKTNNLQIEGLQPVHIMIIFILLEKQAQNWLYSRWGLNKTMISKFTHLDFFLNLDNKGKHLLPVGAASVNHCHEIFKFQYKEEPQLYHAPREPWRVEDFNNQLVAAWRSVKIHNLVKTAIYQGIKEVLVNNQQNRPKSVLKNKPPIKSVLTQLFEDDQVDTMTLPELMVLEKELRAIFHFEVKICEKFNKMKTKIDNRDFVLYQRIKENLERQLRSLDMINLNETPFIPFQNASLVKREITSSLKLQYIDSAVIYCKNNGIDMTKTAENDKLQVHLSELQHQLTKYINRRYSYEMLSGLRLIFEQLSLVLLLTSVVVKCNIVSLIYLILVTNYLLRKSKQRAMRNQVYIIAGIFIFQYWLYLLNLTTSSSPTPFPESPYPNQDSPYGKHLIPLMYKFKFSRNMQNAYFFSLGVEIIVVQTLWIDFWNLALVAMYLYYYRNPVLSVEVSSFVWCHTRKSKQDDQIQLDPHTQNSQSINFWYKLQKYTELMNKKYPAEKSMSTKQKKLRELKDNSPFYLLVKNAGVLLFTTCHIFTMFVILLMALCRRSLISLGYVIALIPYLKDSRSVLKQYEFHQKYVAEIQQITSKIEYQYLSPEQKAELVQDVKKKYTWSFINLLCYYLSIYSYLDFFSQVVYQVPYIPEINALDIFGLRKIYSPHGDSFNYDSFISGKYQAPELNFSNMLMQFLNCIIVCTISTQSEIFKSQGYKQFIQKEDSGLSLLMKLAQMKKTAITYLYNNQKLSKILAIQKTQEQIWGTVDRIKNNVDIWRKSQQRNMLEEYAEQNDDIVLPPRKSRQMGQVKNIAKVTVLDNLSEPMTTNDQQKVMDKEQILKTLRDAIVQARERRSKLIEEQTQHIIECVLPTRASIYLRILQLSQNFIFIQREQEMKNILKEQEQGSQSDTVDLIKKIKSDLYAQLVLQEKETGQPLSEWPEMTLKDLRQTYISCKWSNIIPKWFSATLKAIISNTQFITYVFMISSLFTNAGIVSIMYPFAVFGMALLEETRPGKRFWRFVLSYSLTILLLKYISNLSFMKVIHHNPYFVTFDGYLKLGLHHMPQTKELVKHMLPEMLIVASILCHEIVEQFTGLYKTNETEIESVPQAIERIFSKNRKHRDSLPNSRLTIQQNQSKVGTNQHLNDAEQPNIPLSDYKSSQTTYPAESQIISRGGFWSHRYFQRLFPKIQQQKPGTDYYGWLTLTQLVLCYYLLQKFNLFSATGPYQETNIFQNEMVVILFYQFGCIIFERYIARTEHRMQIERHSRMEQELKPTFTKDQLFEEKESTNDMVVRLVIQKFKFQDLRDKKHMDTLYKLKQQQDADIILTETFITIQQKCKYVLHWVNLVLVHLYVFWYLPTQANLKLYGIPTCNEQMTYGCRDFRYNLYLQNFYLLYVLYFFFSAKQIGEGMPSFRRGSTTMLIEGSDNSLLYTLAVNFIHQVYVNIPMMLEVRCLLDYTMSITTLDLWQTCQIFQYHSDFYICKLSNREYNVKELGKPVSGWNKICYGTFCSVIVLSLLIGPFFLFSGMGGMTSYNPVQSSGMQVWVEINQTTTLNEGDWVDRMSAGTQIFPVKIFANEAPALYDFDEQMFKNRGFKSWAETKFFEPVQLQIFVPTSFSDTTWIASDEVRQTLQKYACIASMQNSNDSVPEGCLQFANITNINNVQIGFQLRMTFDRQQPAGATTAFGIQTRNLDPSQPQDRELINQFSAIMTENCTQPTKPYTLNITDFYRADLLLGQSTDASPIIFSSTEQDFNPKKNVLLTYKCKDQWAIGTGRRGQESPLEFILFSQRVQVGWLQGYSILAFYSGIILTLGGYLRPIFIFTTNRAFIYETNYPDPLLRLCESVHLARARGDLETEEFNFRMLQDILRSPELLHLLTGNNMKTKSIAPSDKMQHSHLIPKAYS